MEDTSAKLKKGLPELLSPAGNYRALVAAIDAGADAVYFGASDFNARMRAKNFTSEELSNALALCRNYGIKSYVTVNTRLHDRELGEALKLIARLWENGATAFIVADIGLASLIKKHIPSAEIHASTQLSGHSSLDAEVFSKLGFSRMVCPREMSLEEIGNLVEKSPIEIEMFVHGAHCVSFSGQCMMSYAMGGRSGNRGECAQPCRLPFDMPGIKNRYPLSLADMSLATHIEDIIKTGVASLKIEGRQKSAEYVYGVTSVYRKLLDEKRNASKEETDYLFGLFNRGKFTSGYLSGSYKGMLGVRGDANVVPSAISKKFDKVEKKIPIDAYLTLEIGKCASLVLKSGEKTAKVEGNTVSENCDGKAMSREAATKNLSRLGNTPFVLRNLTYEADGNAFCTLSELNALRRTACDKLCEIEKRQVPPLPIAVERRKNISKKKAVFTAEVSSVKEISEKAKSFFDKIYVPIEDATFADGEKICVSLPPLAFDGNISEYEKKLSGYTGEVMAHGFGEALFAKRLGLKCVSSFRINVLNSYAAKIASEYFDNICISHEAPLGLLSEIPEKSSVVIYGKIPLMHTQRCMISNGGEVCPFEGNGGRKKSLAEKVKKDSKHITCDGVLCRTEMTDRTGRHFGIIGLCDCSNVIYNSHPIYMADKMSYLSLYPTDRYHFIFSFESAKEIDRVIDAYEKGTAPDVGEIRRIK